MNSIIRNELFNINKYNYFLKSDNSFNNKESKINNENHKSTSKQKKIRVLIVEDEAVTRDTLAEILKEKKYEVITAADGYEAIEKIQNTVVHIAIIDIRLPGINGVETFKMLKKKYSNIKGIMMTAYSISSYIQEARKLGITIFMSKPFDINEILILIKELTCEETN